MHACYLPHLALFRGCIILRCVCFFLIFALNYQQTVLYSYRQMIRDYKIKVTDKLKPNLWIHLGLGKVHRLKESTSASIVSYLHSLNLNNILTFPVAEARFSLIRLMFALLLACHIYAHAR